MCMFHNVFGAKIVSISQSRYLYFQHEDAAAAPTAPGVTLQTPAPAPYTPG